ncbi:MAG: putative amidophosphoribosyltransferase [Ignavibacteria bacterium]|nr:MAG: putative amidophosphoribosyltransferase [Ignavibacteria bacterium]KAF0161730.1 MAG: putative amidophosphoribosyltransferase [Ignavibacteria bacterium]
MQRTELAEKLCVSANQLLDFFFPSFCAACKIKLSCTERFVCPSCISKIQKASQERIEHEFQRKFLSSQIIAGFHSAFVFESEKELQTILHLLKYNGKFLLGKFLGEIAAAETIAKIKLWSADLILPVPLHSLKKAERGYNQSDFICKGISKVLKIPYKAKIIKRTRFTLSQTTMTLEERKQNVHEAFEIKRKKDIAGKRIIIVDDVITTGATITECARVLKENGAEEIFAFSVAIAD